MTLKRKPPARASRLKAASDPEAGTSAAVLPIEARGQKGLVELIDGMRESAQSSNELLLDLRRRGLAIGPELAVADGTLGCW